MCLFVGMFLSMSRMHVKKVLDSPQTGNIKGYISKRVRRGLGFNM